MKNEKINSPKATKKVTGRIENNPRSLRAVRSND
jgi:hypothetical protein